MRPLTRYPQIRAVIMTGFRRRRRSGHCYQARCLDFLIKPFQLSQLARVLQASIEQAEIAGRECRAAGQLRDRFRFDNIIGRHSTMQHLFSTLELRRPDDDSHRAHPGRGPAPAKSSSHAPFTTNSPRAEPSGSSHSMPRQFPRRLQRSPSSSGHVKARSPVPCQSRMGRFELAHRGTLFHRRGRLDVAPASSEAACGRCRKKRSERVGESRSVKFGHRVVAADQRRAEEDGEGKDLPGRSLLSP